MQQCYVDDNNLMSNPLPAGARLNSDGKIEIVDEYVQTDSEIPSDQRTAKLYGEIANDVSEFIKVTVDYPSAHSSGWMPILDLLVKISNNEAVYKFYKKEVSNPRVILASSAMPIKVKRHSLAQEGIRRLRNTKRSLPWSVKADILSEYSHKLKISGYSESFRLDIIQSAVIGFERQCEAADQGIRPLHRPRSFDQENRRKAKLLSPRTWYRPASVVGFYPPSPGGQLAKEVQEIVTEELGRIGLSAKIVECECQESNCEVGPYRMFLQ